MSSDTKQCDYHVTDLDEQTDRDARERPQSAHSTSHQSAPSVPGSDVQPTDPSQTLTPVNTALNDVHTDCVTDLSAGSPASWTSPPAHSLAHFPSVKMDIVTGNQGALLTKMEPVDFQIKNELLNHLKQEYAETTSSKDGQLREMLLMSSMKTLADDTASKTLLQLAGQAPDTNTPEGHILCADTKSSTLNKTDLEEGGNEGGTRPKKIRHKKRVNGKKICLVCGDKALAHNFDVITCESCKAFFRRNALKSQNLQRCMFQNSCTIDKNTRRFCPSCRLKKCFDIGMKAELMLDEEERRLRQEKKAQRIRRQAASSSTVEESGELRVESSGNTMDVDTFSPDHSTTPILTPSHSFSPPDIHQQASSSSSLQPSPLPSFHTLRDPMTPSPSASSQSTAYSLSSTFGVSPGMAHSQPTSGEHSPFSSSLGQLSTASSMPFTNTLSPSPQSITPILPQSVAAFTAKSPRLDVSSSMESLIQKRLQQQQQQQQLEQQRQQQQQQQQQTQHQQEQEQAERIEEEQSQPQSADPVSSLTDDNATFSLPGPAARIFKHVPRDQLPSDPFMYWIVSSEERLMLANLTNAYQEVLLSLTERGLRRNVPISDSYFIQDFLNEIDDAMYKIVQFSKHIADFRQVRKEDQIAMLKSSAMHTLGIACCAAYVHERDCWLSLRGDLTLSHLRQLTNDDPYIQVGVEYCRSVKSLVKNDFTIYALIHCMILFDPRDAKIVDRQLINQTRDKYVIMLKHYLESQYSYLFADEYFVAIQERVREMIHLAKTGNAMFKRYSSVFQPLITEMLSSS